MSFHFFSSSVNWLTEPQMFCGKCGINKVFEVRESLYIQVHSVQMVFRYKSNFLLLTSDNWPLVQQLSLLMSCQVDTSQDDMHVSFPECYTVQAQSIKQKDPNPLSLFLCDSVTLQRTQKSRNSEVRYFFTGRDLSYFAKSFKLAVSISFLIVTREKKNTWLLCLCCICSTSWKAFSSQSSASRTFARSTSVSQLLALKSRPQAIFQYNILLCCFFTFNQNGLSKNSISTRIG